MDDFDDTFWDFDGDMDDDDDTFGGLDFDGDRGMEADDDFLEDMLFLEAMHALQKLPPQSQNRHYQGPKHIIIRVARDHSPNWSFPIGNAQRHIALMAHQCNF